MTSVGRDRRPAKDFTRLWKWYGGGSPQMITKFDNLKHCNLLISIYFKSFMAILFEVKSLSHSKKLLKQVQGQMVRYFKVGSLYLLWIFAIWSKFPMFLHCENVEDYINEFHKWENFQTLSSKNNKMQEILLFCILKIRKYD